MSGSEAKHKDILLEVYQKLIYSDSTEQIAKTILAHVFETVPSIRASVTLFDFEKETITSFAAIFHDSGMPAGTTLPLDAFGGDLEKLANNEIDMVDDINDLSELPLGLQILQKDGLRSFVCVPLILEQKLLGSINISSDQSKAFTFKELNFLSKLASPLSMALQKAKIQEELLKKNQQLEKDRIILSTVDDAVSYISPDAVYLEVNETYCRIFHRKKKISLGYPLQSCLARIFLQII
ncbi:MAG: GAF domain-containing protein [Desulfohalobiaceae bacterium]|nr:GAF domain-containing protein [Desulfohalobiaceae bacterium]